MISEERKNIKRSIPVALGRAELTMISARKCMEIVGDSGAIKTRKKLTTDCLTLDLRRLGQKSRLIPNTCLQWVWKDVRGNVQGTVGIFLWTDEIELIYGQSSKSSSVADGAISWPMRANTHLAADPMDAYTACLRHHRIYW
jgi:hypothetical protein